MYQELPVDNTFHMDFAIAEKFGYSAIMDTYKRAFREWKSNYEMITALTLVLNHRIWLHWERGNQTLAEVYDKLWREVDQWCVDNLKGDELRYFYDVTD